MPSDCIIRQTIEILRHHGEEPTVIEYLKTPLDSETLRSFGLPAREIIPRQRGRIRRVDLADPSKTDAELFAAIAEHPILLQRPLVIVGKRAVVARPPERVNALLDRAS